MSKKKPMQNFPFESTKPYGEGFVKICDSMINSLAWQCLTLRQRGLYIELKTKFTVYKNQDTNVNNISMPHSEYSKLYGDKTTFWKDIDMLIANGFIKVVEHGYFARAPNIYGFSSRWKGYGTEEFNIPINEKRITITY